MNTLSYKEQFDKITEAYIKGDIKPYESNFCFCGTIAPECYSSDGYKNWNNHDGKFCQDNHFYTLEEYGSMESALFESLSAISVTGKISRVSHYRIQEGDDRFEDRLFEGMCAALEVLKNIHKSRGENVEEEFEFKKRQLAI